jgi:hypothetical protein
VDLAVKCLTELATLLVEEGGRRGMGLYRAQAGRNYVVNTARRVRVKHGKGIKYFLSCSPNP